MIQTARRSFLIGVAALIAAPAIVRASSIMPVHGLVMDVSPAAIAMAPDFYAALCDVTRRAFVPRLYVQLYDAMPLGVMPRELWGD